MFRVRRHFGFISIGWSSSLSLVSNRKFKIDDGSFICLYVNSASEFFFKLSPRVIPSLIKVNWSRQRLPNLFFNPAFSRRVSGRTL